MLVGKTHTGKSTFARRLAKEIPKTVVLETDPITIFLRENWPNLQLHENVNPYSKIPVSTLRLRILIELLGTALKQSFNVVLANANLQKYTRTDLLKVAKKYPGYKTVLIFINLPDQVILSRVESAKKDARVLLVSKDFSEVLAKQNTVIQRPDASEADYFFEINDGSKEIDIIKKVKKLVSE